MAKELILRAYGVNEALETHIKALEEGDGEPSPDAIEELKRALTAHDNLVGELAAWHNYTEAQEAKLKAEAEEIQPILDRITADAKRLQKRKAFIQMVVEKLLPPGPDSRYVDDKVSLFYTKSESVEVFDVDALPLECVEPKTIPVVKAIKAALSTGKKVEGARLRVNWNLQIKQGGENAKANQRKLAKERSKKIVEHEPEQKPDTDNVQEAP